MRDVDILEGILYMAAVLAGIRLLGGRMHGRPSSVLRYIDEVWRQEDKLPVRSSALDALDLIL